MQKFLDRLKFAEDLFSKDEARSIYVKNYKQHIEGKLIDSQNVHLFLLELNRLIGERVTLKEEKERLDELRSILGEMRKLIEGVEKTLPKNSKQLEYLKDSNIKYRFALLRKYITEETEYAYKRQNCCIIKAREFCLEFVRNRVNDILSPTSKII